MIVAHCVPWKQPAPHSKQTVSIGTDLEKLHANRIAAASPPPSPSLGRISPRLRTITSNTSDTTTSARCVTRLSAEKIDRVRQKKDLNRSLAMPRRTGFHTAPQLESTASERYRRRRVASLGLKNGAATRKRQIPIQFVPSSGMARRGAARRPTEACGSARRQQSSLESEDCFFPLSTRAGPAWSSRVRLADQVGEPRTFSSSIFLYLSNELLLLCKMYEVQLL